MPRIGAESRGTDVRTIAVTQKNWWLYAAAHANQGAKKL